MEFEDSRNGLFVEPNAYVQRKDNEQKKLGKGLKKIVFQEPYDCLPNYYINNGFKKGNCYCVPNTENKEKIESRHEKSATNKPFGFDFKNLMPMLGMFGQDMGGIGKILSIFNEKSGGIDLTKIVGSLVQNKDGLGSLLKIFSNKTNNNNCKTEIKSTDFEIKNYTRVQ